MLYGLYWAVNTLELAPNEMLNYQMAAAVLSASEEGRKLLSELAQEYGEPLEKVWDRIVPSFKEAHFVQ
jgi:hypothetical protein